MLVEEKGSGFCAGIRWRVAGQGVDAREQHPWRTIPTVLFVDSSDWRISLEPTGAGTRIVQTFRLTKFPRWWEWMVAWANPPHIDRSAALTEDLRRLAAIAAADTPTAKSAG